MFLIIFTEEVLEEMRQFYKEREAKAGSTCQQQSKLIEHLQQKLDQVGKKKTIRDMIFGSKLVISKQKDNVSPPDDANTKPPSYSDLENELGNKSILL